MIYLLIFVHVVACLLLILVVLLQQGKGADWAGAFGGGGSQTVFGARGASTFLSKATTAAAIIFMLTSLTLTIIWQPGSTSVIRETAPAAPAPAPSEGTTGAAPVTPKQEGAPKAEDPSKQEGASKATPNPAPTPEPAKK